MKDLIARLENATGPDREIDTLIEDVAGLAWPIGRSNDYRRTPSGTEMHIQHYAERYTASIDAALTLMPACSWIVAFTEDDTETQGTRVWLTNYVTDDVVRNGTLAATPAIALCVAALKAVVPNAPKNRRPRTP